MALVIHKAQDHCRAVFKYPKIYSMCTNEEFALGIDPKSLHATVLMQTVYNTVIWHSGEFLKCIMINLLKKGKIMVA